MVEEDVPVSEIFWDSVSILRTLSPEKTSRTTNVNAPLVTLSEPIETPKQNDFPTKLIIADGSISGSSIYQ